MSSRRFEVTRVPEPTRSNPPIQQSEIIPLVHIENEIPPPPPLPISISSTNNEKSSKFLNIFLQRKIFDTRRRATIAAAVASAGQQFKRSSSVDIITTNEFKVTSIDENEVEDSDVYSTTQSNNYDTTSSRTANKFLQELRLKRREIREKAKNFSIDQRIASNRRKIIRAQDIFAVHFELNEDETDIPLDDPNLFTEESQEKIRNDIFTELNRQRKKQHHKHYRHLLLGRALLMIMTSLFLFMSLTLIYVVTDLYNRATNLDAKLPENEFISMAHDIPPSYY